MPTKKIETKDERPAVNYGRLSTSNRKFNNKITVDLDKFPYFRKTIGNKKQWTLDRIKKALNDVDIVALREASLFFYNTNAYMKRAVDYLTSLYRYDYSLYPVFIDDFDVQEQKQIIINEFNKISNYLDDSGISLLCLRIVKDVILYGNYFGYIDTRNKGRFVIQDLPREYCRTRFSFGGKPVVEFNFTYFDKVSSNERDRQIVLEAYPSEFAELYLEYKAGKLVQELTQDKGAKGWATLDPKFAFKIAYSISGIPDDIPPLVSAIPAILNNEDISDLLREQLVQSLWGLITQKFEVDKEGNPVISETEMETLHETLVSTLSANSMLDVVSSPAKIELQSFDQVGTASGMSSIKESEQLIYSALGISRNLFATEGNLALEKSILDDEATLRNVILQISQVFDQWIDLRFNKNKNAFYFKFRLLESTAQNVDRLREQAQKMSNAGYSKLFLPNLMGQSASEVLGQAIFESDILNVQLRLLPLMLNSTMSAEGLAQIAQLREIENNGGNIDLGDVATAASSAETASTTTDTTSDSEGGRPALPADQRSEKTIANQASQ